MSLLVLGSVGSTMDVARQMLRTGQTVWDSQQIPVPSGVQALEQTQGRGQRGRTWYAQPGQSLCCTLFLPLLPEEAAAPAWIALAAGAAALNAVQRALALEPPAEPIELGLKWPNDLLLNSKKLGGVLIELAVEPSGETVALVGIGINLACMHFPAEIAEHSTSLALAGITPPSARQMAELVDDCLRMQVEAVRANGTRGLLRLWREHDKTVGRSYRAEGPNGSELGTALGIDEHGALILRLDSGATLAIQSAAVITEEPAGGSIDR